MHPANLRHRATKGRSLGRHLPRNAIVSGMGRQLLQNRLTRIIRRILSGNIMPKINITVNVSCFGPK